MLHVVNIFEVREEILSWKMDYFPNYFTIYVAQSVFSQRLSISFYHLLVFVKCEMLLELQFSNCSFNSSRFSLIMLREIVNSRPIHLFFLNFCSIPDYIQDLWYTSQVSCCICINAAISFLSVIRFCIKVIVNTLKL